MVKLSEGVKLLISAMIGVVVLYFLSNKYNPTMSITLAFLLAALSKIIMDNL